MLNYTATCRGQDKKPGDNILNGDFSCGIGAISANINDILKLEEYDCNKLSSNLIETITNPITATIESSIGEITRIGNLVAALRSNAD